MHVVDRGGRSTEVTGSLVHLSLLQRIETYQDHPVWVSRLDSKVV